MIQTLIGALPKDWSSIASTYAMAHDRLSLLFQGMEPPAQASVCISQAHGAQTGMQEKYPHTKC